MFRIKNLILIFLIIFIVACKKNDAVTPEVPPITTVPGGSDNLEAFQVTLSTNDLKSGETGSWSIVSGLVEDKVSFSDKSKSNTVFHGMPGETYELKWTVTANGKTVSESITKVVLKPLVATIKNTTPGNSTKFFFTGNKYDKGLWEIEGKYARLVKNNTDPEVPTNNDAEVHFQGYDNTSYKIKFTTYYGSKSASVTLDLKTGDYLESEALIDLKLTPASKRIGVDAAGHIVKLDLSADNDPPIQASILIQDMVKYPALQGLKYLKNLDLSHTLIPNFPAVIADKYHQLEELRISGTNISVVPNNIGNLIKLKVLEMASLSIVELGINGVSHLPESFAQLENLETLDLSNSGLLSLPNSIAQLKKLKKLSWTSSSSTLPDFIGNLSNLEELIVSIKGNLPASFTKLSKLNKLQILNSGSDVKLPEDFGDLKALDQLYIQGAYKVLPESFSKLNLRSLLILQGATASLGALPENFGDLKQLEYLKISGSFSQLPASFTKLSKLKELHLTYKFDVLPEDFGKLNELVIIYLSSINLKTLPVSFADLKKLEYLKISSGLNAFPAALFKLTDLKTLDLSNNKISSVSDDIAKLSKNLTVLDLTSNSINKVSGDRIKQLLPNTTVTY